MKPALFTSLWFLACSVVFAQEKPAEPPKEEPPAEEEAARVPWPKLDVQYLRWGLRGNESTYRRYGTPAEGLTIRALEVDWNEPSPAEYGFLAMRGQPGRDFVTETAFTWGPKAMGFQGFYQDASFMVPSPYAIDPSNRRIAEGSLRYPVGHGYLLTARVRSENFERIEEGPAISKFTRTQDFDTRVAGPLSDGQLDLSYHRSRFFDRTDGQPDTTTNTLRGAVLQPVGNLSLEGSYAQSRIQQTGRSRSLARAWNLDGGLPLGDSADLQFGIRLQRYDLPAIINAYVRERHTSWARLIGSIRGARAQLGFRRIEAERLRADQSFVDVPKWNIFDGRVTGRLANGARWSVRGSYEETDGIAMMQTDDPHMLYWDEKTAFQVKFDHGGENWTGYASIDWKRFENSPRQVEIDSWQWTVGGTYQLRPNLELYSEFAYDRAKSGFREQDANIGLQAFLPSSRVSTFGANWTIDDDTWLSGSFTEYFVDNDNPIFDRGGNVATRFLSINLTRRDKSGHEYGLMLAPGRYADRVIRQLGYEAAIAAVTVKLRF
jgi:hypothetical protein